MQASTLESALRNTISDVRLLDHPFYKRWQAGELRDGELKAYSEQYRHFEEALPEILRSVVERLPAGPSREYLADNLADESGAKTGQPHVELFDTFLSAVDGDRTVAPTAATTALLDTYRRLAAESPIAGTSAIVAYEMQAPEIAESKGDGLRCHYALNDQGTAFWDLHATLDQDHAAWAISSLAAATDDADYVSASARQAAEAWWNFLDERELAAPVAA